MGDVVQDFYGLLRVFALRGSSGKQWQPREDTDHIPSESNRTWQKYIDYLSFLGDYDVGGKTCVSIVVAEATTGPRYLMWTQGPKKTATENHIRRVLEALREIGKNSGSDGKDTRKKILSESINFGKKKVTNYKKLLSISVAEMKKHRSKDFTAEEIRLQDFLVKFCSSQAENLEICQKADDFSCKSVLKPLKSTLEANAQSESDSTYWRGILHYITRLSRWPRASRLLVRVCERYPRCVEDFTLESIPPTAPLLQEPPSSNLTAKEFFERLYPSHDPATLQNAIRSQRRVGRENGEDTNFDQVLQSTRDQYVHCEVVTLEFMWEHNLNFFEGDRYIGCSKRSCYCCDLFFQRHPLKPIRRACHGNVWKKWAFPERLRSTHTFHTVALPMLEQIKKDFLQRLDDRPKKVSVRCDSTTAESTSVASCIQRLRI